MSHELQPHLLSSDHVGRGTFYRWKARFEAAGYPGLADEFKTGAADSEYLDDFWIDQTEVTNAMYAKCVKAGTCQALSSVGSSTRASNSRYP